MTMNYLWGSNTYFFIHLKDCVYMCVHLCAGSYEDQKSILDTLDIVTDIGHLTLVLELKYS